MREKFLQERYLKKLDQSDFDDVFLGNPVGYSWLKNGIYALAIAGIYSIILVVLRTPQINHLISNKDLFKSSLIVHVNLSVLVWLMSIISTFWSYGIKEFSLASSFSKLAFAGMVLMSIGPFVGESTAFMNNYVPMLENLSFIVGLTLFGVAVLFFSICTFFLSFYDLKAPSSAVCFNGWFKLTSSGMFISVWICMVLSYFSLAEVSKTVELDQDFFYELLYWSGGHYLQFIYSQGFIFALVVLLEAATMHKSFMLGIYKALFVINFLFAAIGFYGHINYEIIDGAFKEFYTLHMIYAGGIVPILGVLILAYDLYLIGISKTQSDDVRPFSISNRNTTNLEDKALRGRKIFINNIATFSAISSIILFALGGFIGALISGVNVTIPAHYHGSIVGISICFMGIAYLYCYQSSIKESLNEGISLIDNKKTNRDNRDNLVNLFIGGRSNIALESAVVIIPQIDKNIQKFYRESKLAIWQICLFTFGQIIHISGLALAGGFGVMRKSPNEQIPLSAKVYMGMVGGGGLLAIVCGLIFVYICVKKLKSI